MDGETVKGKIILDPGSGFEQALLDLEGFEYIWIITWFDRVRGWKPKVLPPRTRIRRGMFATRSPHRPNPIGISLCRLISMKGRIITVENPDLLDRTPVLDIKPYLPGIEAKPGAASGWVGDIDNQLRAAFSVEFDPEATRQIEMLQTRHGIDLRERIVSVLCRDPFPHPYRRIKLHADGGFVQSIRAWRVYFSVKGDRVTIRRIGSGFKTRADISSVVSDTERLAHEELM
jgi:tRNA-Thr(GGU) m(6)t(6)A37 methyltransferase TsaA